MAQLPVSLRPKEEDFVLVNTTLPVVPLPPNAARQPIITDRLVIRPWQVEDLAQVRLLRTQPEVMRNTRKGHIDLDEAETQEWLAHFLAPHDATTHSLAITLRETGEVIGSGGTHLMASSFGWPEMGYMFRTEFWGKGYATEFLRAYLATYAELPRQKVAVRVDPRTVVVKGDGDAEELLTGGTPDTNVASQKVMEKSGFERFVTWLNDEDGLTIHTYRAFPGRKGAS